MENSQELISKNKKQEISTDEAGLLKPKNIDDAYRMAVAFHQSKLLPARFNSPEMIMTAFQFVLELGLKPLTAMRQLAVVNGTPSLFGDLPLSLCYSSGKLEWIKEWLFDKDGKEISIKNANVTAVAFGAACVVKRKGDPEQLESIFTMDDARAAGLLKSPVWTSYAKRMLRYRARSSALKDKFPDALNGISIAEYDYNVIPTDNDDQITTKTNEDDTKKSIIEKLAPKKDIEIKPNKVDVFAKIQDPIPMAEEPPFDMGGGSFEEFVKPKK